MFLNYLERFVGVVQSSRWMNAIKNAINKTAYVNIVLAVFIFIYYQFDQYGTLSDGFRKDTILMYQLYCIMIATMLSYFVATETLAEQVDTSYRIMSVFLSMLSGVILIPLGFATVYPLIAMFTSSIVSVFFNHLTSIKLKSDKFPPAVLDYYNRLWPALIMFAVVFTLVFIFRGFFPFMATGFQSITGFMAGPLMIFVIISVICMFWILGIHGVGVIGTLMRPFWLHMLIVNGLMIVMNQTPLYIGSETFFGWCVWIGGSGCTLGLTFDMLFFSKSNHLSSLSKACAPSNIFNINENIIFGTPIVDNKHFKIPFFLAPITTGAIAYFAFKFGYVMTPSIVAPWVIPMPIGIFISTLGDVRSLILAVLLIVVSMVIYLPFLWAYDRECLKNERS